MDAERWRKIEQLYHSALAREKGQRAAFLEQASGGDDSLQQEVRSLLAQAEESGSFLEAPALDMAARDLAMAPTIAGGPGAPGGHSPPEMIGRYRIVGVLGEGGMGTVYEAEQEQPRRIVALKVIKPGFATPEHLWRFEHESKALGRLQHPGIAQIYEASTADTGFGRQPYFAMELIRGLSLLEYMEAHHLGARERLALTAKICDAVQHAHQRGLIHRDLKPGNIIVDETGQPKILDFGVARVAEGDAHQTRQTHLGQIIGTLAYMSPEQVLGDPQEVDTRSDVYTLGVILYEVLSGRLPYDVGRRQLHEAARTIREEDPTSLSSISRVCRGDIETIVGKALEKDKARRYASAADLAADIRRYLSDEPITARPPSASYQLQKFARRHRALVAGVAAVFVVLAGGIVASSWEAVRANRAGQAALVERDRAAAAEQSATRERDLALQAQQTATSERNRAVAAEGQAVQERNRAVTEKRRADDEAAMAKAVNNFVQNDLLAQASANTQARPDSKPDPDLKVRTALDRAAAGIEGKFEKQPIVEASIRDTIGRTYFELGIYPEAQKQLERALSLRRRVLGDNDPATLANMDGLGDVYQTQGKYAEAEALYAKALEVKRRSLGEENRETLTSMNNLGISYQNDGKYGEAEPLLTKALELQRRVLGEDDPFTITSMNNLALLYQNQGKYAQAEPLQIQSLEISRRIRGEEHPSTLTYTDNLATLYFREGKYEQAEPLFAKVVESERRVLGPEHPDTLISTNNLASVLGNEGKYAEAEPLRVTVLEAQRRILGEEHPNTLRMMNNLGVLYVKEGKYALAEPLLVKGLEIRRRLMGPDHPDTLVSMTGLATLYRAAGRDADAESLLNSILEARRRVSGPAHPETSDVMTSLAEVRLQRKKYGAAETLLREALSNYEKASSNSWRRYRCQSLLGAAVAAEGNYAEAEPLLVSGYQGMLQRAATIPFEDRPGVARAGERVIALYESWGKPEKAAPWRAQLASK